jgi:ubiquitin carboxyl-terminal hydrolase L5
LAKLAYRKPVHGLIFLYEYTEEEAQEETENGDDVWFANQTTDNACATLALFNIIMNAEDIELGDRLSAFYEKSADLSPPFKGDFLSNTTWIRTVHNQFTRRLDLLNADLVLSNQVDLLAKQKQLEKKKKKQSSRLHGAKRQKKTKKPISDAAYHFIAYVPVDGKVYQLDGLEKAPVCVGTIPEGEDWTNVAKPTIEARIAQYSGQLQFSLLALCRSPLESLRVDIVTNQIAGTTVRHELDKKLKEKGVGDLDSIDPRSEEGLWLSEEDENQYGILPSHKQHPDRRKLEALTEWLICYSGYPDVRRRSEDELRARMEDICAEQSRLRAEFKTEQTAHAQDVRRAQGRKKDYTPVIHRWVQMLAEKGVLGDIAAET